MSKIEYSNHKARIETLAAGIIVTLKARTFEKLQSHIEETADCIQDSKIVIDQDINDLKAIQLLLELQTIINTNYHEKVANLDTFLESIPEDISPLWEL